MCACVRESVCVRERERASIGPLTAGKAKRQQCVKTVISMFTFWSWFSVLQSPGLHLALESMAMMPEIFFFFVSVLLF